MERESCQNCMHREGCLIRDLAIFQMFIVTGRDESVPVAKEKLDIRPSCTNWELAAPRPAEPGQ